MGRSRKDEFAEIELAAGEASDRSADVPMEAGDDAAVPSSSSRPSSGAVAGPFVPPELVEVLDNPVGVKLSYEVDGVVIRENITHESCQSRIDALQYSPEAVALWEWKKAQIPPA